jgi:hypothetical protein
MQLGREPCASMISGTGSGSEGFGGVPGSGTTVHSGGYEFAGGGGPFDGGMRQTDLLLSQFGGVISGFDLGDEIGPHSLGFGSSSSAMPWIQEASGTPGVDKGGNTFNLALLGQYSAANFRVVPKAISSHLPEGAGALRETMAGPDTTLPFFCRSHAGATQGL